MTRGNREVPICQSSYVLNKKGMPMSDLQNRVFSVANISYMG